jgi:hypothetical protein
MAPRTIFLRIGERDRISLSNFIQSLKNFLGLLRDFDATISKDKKGSVIWEVVELKKNSPPIVGVSPTTRRGMMDYSHAVEAQILESTAEITARGERTAVMSDAALQRLERLSSNTRSIGSHSIFMMNGASKDPIGETLITEKTFENVRQYTQPKFSSQGSIVGKLDSITVHRANEFRVWDEVTGKPVRCKFEMEQDRLVRDLLRQRVIVSGEILSNSVGMPILMNLEELSTAEKKELPTIDQMRGLVKDFTNGLSLGDYLKEIADE